MKEGFVKIRVTDLPEMKLALREAYAKGERDTLERVTRIIRDLKDAALTYGAPGRDQHVQLVAFENVLLALGVEDNQPNEEENRMDRYTP